MALAVYRDRDTGDELKMSSETADTDCIWCAHVRQRYRWWHPRRFSRCAKVRTEMAAAKECQCFELSGAANATSET